MLPSWCTDTITVTRPAQASSRGSTVADWEHATTATVSGCSVQTNATAMDLDGRTQTELSGVVYAPPGADIQAGDRITYGGATYAVVGEPMAWRSPTGRVSNLQVRITDWRG